MAATAAAPPTSVTCVLSFRIFHIRIYPRKIGGPDSH